MGRTGKVFRVFQDEAQQRSNNAYRRERRRNRRKISRNPRFTANNQNRSKRINQIASKQTQLARKESNLCERSTDPDDVVHVPTRPIRCHCKRLFRRIRRHSVTVALSYTVQSDCACGRVMCARISETQWRNKDAR